MTYSDNIHIMYINYYYCAVFAERLIYRTSPAMQTFWEQL